MRVLLIEDHPRLQQELQVVLAELDGVHVVQAVSTAAQAIDWLAGHPDGWDLAVVDLFLAQGHGFQVLRALRARAAHQRAVVLTNYTRDPVRAHAAEAGADALFDKSCEMEAFLDWCARQDCADAPADPAAPLTPGRSARPGPGAAAP